VFPSSSVPWRQERKSFLFFSCRQSRCSCYCNPPSLTRTPRTTTVGSRTGRSPQEARSPSSSVEPSRLDCAHGTRRRCGGVCRTKNVLLLIGLLFLSVGNQPPDEEDLPVVAPHQAAVLEVGDDRGELVVHEARRHRAGRLHAKRRHGDVDHRHAGVLVQHVEAAVALGH
jgi:hypothetical protein